MVVVNFIDGGNRRIYKYHERLAGLGNIKRAIAIFTFYPGHLNFDLTW
jgi:hypothetical protein